MELKWIPITKQWLQGDLALSCREGDVAQHLSMSFTKLSIRPLKFPERFP